MYLSPHKNADSVRRVLATRDWTLLQQREIRGVSREVFRTPDGYVVKRYLHHTRPQRIRRPWVLEHRALCRLQGRGAPRPVGYLEESVDGKPRVSLVRSFVEGQPIGEIDTSLASEIATLLAGFHAAGVTTDDAHRHNFVRSRQAGLVFLDFGRARVFHRSNPLLMAAIAVDLHRFYRASLKRDDDVWGPFLDAYFRHSTFGALGNALIRRLVAIDMRRYRWVRGTPG